MNNTNLPLDDGGPAFPNNDSHGCSAFPGMTLRDYFAGEVLEKCLHEFWDSDADVGYYDAALAAYKAADAMIKARGYKK